LAFDPRSADGHACLLPVAGIRWRSFGTDIAWQIDTRRCGNCDTNWTRRENAAEPFTAWVVSKDGESTRRPDMAGMPCARNDY
jgi:hypothetical protein